MRTARTPDVPASTHGLLSNGHASLGPHAVGPLELPTTAQYARLLRRLQMGELVSVVLR
jgi:hypothetical protein